jgi:uncharacterized protein with GYD domain
MPTYVALLNWTDQGARNVKETVRRAGEQRAALEKLGVKLHTLYWTQGAYDLIGVAEAPDDETMSAAMLAAAGAGNIRSQTLRAYGEEEMQGILQKLG